MSDMYQVRKVSDEGSSSPFMARLFIGLLHLRDQLYLMHLPDHQRPSAQDAFERAFKPLFEAAQAARDAALEATRITAAHLTRIESGQAVHFRPTQYDILESIDSPLGQAFDKFIDQAIVATKTALQGILRDQFGLDIGFFFAKDAPFAAGIAQLRASGEEDLATFLEQARDRWHSGLQGLRSKHEHERWTLPGLSYVLRAPNAVSVVLPEVLGVNVDEYARVTANQLLLFIEDLMAYAMSRRPPGPLYLTEIPPEARDTANPQRFRVAARGLETAPRWVIRYHEGNDFV